MKIKVLLLSAIFPIVVLSGCGGGGGSSASSATPAAAAPTSTAYQAGVTVGDNGSLCLNTNTTAVAATANCPALNPLSYSLNIQNSSYGLEGKTISGTFTAKADGSYGIDGSTNGTIFVYPNYALMVIKLEFANPSYANYFSKNPYIQQDIYVPIFALVKSSLLATVDAITSNGLSMEFRSISMGRVGTGTGDPTYTSEASRGVITKLSETSFSVASCSNNGSSAENSNLTDTNCTGGRVTTKTYSYDVASGSWLVTPVDAANQVLRAYFVADVMTNSVVGYVDTADSSMNTSKFAIASVVPANTLQPAIGGGTATFTSYQACSSKDNCAGNSGDLGVDRSTGVVIQDSGTTLRSTYMSDGPCDYIVRPNGVVNGYMDAVYTGSPGACRSPGSRPDNMMFFFGSRTTSNGKSVTLSVMAGYDPTITVGPSQKISINYIAQN